MKQKISLTDLARSLTGSIGINEFNKSIRERTATHFMSALNPVAIKYLFTLERVEVLLMEDALPIANLDSYQAGHLIKLTELMRAGERTIEVVRRQFDAGSTIRIRDIQKFDPVLNAFTSAVQDQFAARAQINLYLTPPAQMGFPPHWDIMDVFVIQVAGGKDWRIFHEYQDAVELPMRGTLWEPQRYRPIGTPEEFTMQVGDTLYLPRGAMHQAMCTNHGSAHLAIGIDPLNYADFLCHEIQRLAIENVALRLRLPWSTADSPTELATLEANVRQLFIELSSQLNLSSRLAAERDEFAIVTTKIPTSNIFASIEGKQPSLSHAAFNQGVDDTKGECHVTR